MRISGNQIHISVTELSRLGSGGKAVTPSGASLRRAALGRQAQQIYQAEVLKGTENYETEISLFHRDLLAGYEIFLGGRIDGRFADKQTVYLDEIKTVTLRPEDFRRLEDETFSSHRNQLAIYQWLTSLDFPGMEISSRLIYINLIDDTVRVLPLQYDNKQCEKIYLEQVGKILSFLEKRRAGNKKRRLVADKIVWPFPEKRAEQREMIRAIDSVLEKGEEIIINAPTGTGKTAAALYPAIRYALANGKHLLFLTSKNPQQELAKETIRRMAPRETGIITLQMRATRQMCANDHFFCNELVCPFLHNFEEKLEKSGVTDELLQKEFIEPDEIYREASEAMVCPAEVMLMLVPRADILIGDFNYAFDPRAFLKSIFQDEYDDYIAIVDEAHNLYPRVQQAYSPALAGTVIRQLLDHVSRQKAAVFRLWTDFFRHLENIFGDLTLKGEIEFAGQARYMPEIDFDKWRDLNEELDDVFIKYFLYKIEKSHFIENDPLDQFYFDFSFFTTVLAYPGREFYRIYEAESGGVLKIYCADSSTVLRKRMSGFHSVIAMSATLKPFDFFAGLSGLDAGEARKLDVPSPFPPENLMVILNREISTKYKQRQRFILKIAEFINRTAEVKPGNYIVFFPSFEYLEMCWPFVRLPGFEKVKQPRKSSAAERGEILGKMGGEKPVLLFAVMGGVFSEGVDFPGDLAIGAYIISPALPTFDYYRELQRYYFEKEYGKGEAYAYTYPGMAKAVQAAGRIIRTREDRGVIFLLGKRFTEDVYQNLFPENWFPLTELSEISEVKKELKNFWDKTGAE